MNILEIKNLSFRYNLGNEPVLNNINLNIEQGEFITVCGKSGCGKTTLLRHLKTAISPYGEKTGDILFQGKALSETDKYIQTSRIGFVSQNPENQIVTDKVFHELAFGLESLGTDSHEIRLRVAEMASFFGMQSMFDKNISELSGGQKQLLVLASIMTMKPEVIVLDEPTSQLDPIAAEDFINMLLKINRNLGVTIIIAEHRLDEILPYSSRVIVMEKGNIIIDDNPENVCLKLKSDNNSLIKSMPIPSQIYIESGYENSFCPLTVRDGRNWFLKCNENVTDKYYVYDEKTSDETEDILIKVKDIYYRYDRKSRDVLEGVNLDIKDGTILGILGGNGTGKSTLLSVIAGLQKQYSGKIVNRNDVKIAMLPQEPEMLFVKNTIYEELAEMKSDKTDEVIKLCNIENILDRNIYDVSGGERQRAGLAKILLTDAQLLLFDEPTKGMDNEFKSEFGKLLYKLKEAGKTIVIVSHDTEFCGEWTLECALMFNGDIIVRNNTREFFTNNNFYTTISNRIAGDILINAVTKEDVVGFLRDKGKYIKKNINNKEPEYIINHNSKSISFLGFMSLVFIVLIVPLTIFAGMYLLDDKKYLFISLMIVLECMCPFFIMFEKNGKDTRQIVLISALSAICVASRAVFYMLPEFKPVFTIVIICGVCLGPEGGFLVGAITMIVSNMLFGQGPWTPWQMFAMGITGFISGIMFVRFRKNKFYNTISGRFLLSFYSLLAPILIYGLIMNPAAALMSRVRLSRAVLVSYYAAGLPMDITQGIASFAYTMLLSQVMIEKIDRVKEKYGL